MFCLCVTLAGIWYEFEVKSLPLIYEVISTNYFEKSVAVSKNDFFSVPPGYGRRTSLSRIFRIKVFVC